MEPERLYPLMLAFWSREKKMRGVVSIVVRLKSSPRGDEFALPMWRSCRAATTHRMVAGTWRIVFCSWWWSMQGCCVPAVPVAIQAVGCGEGYT